MGERRFRAGSHRPRRRGPGGAGGRLGHDREHASEQRHGHPAAGAVAGGDRQGRQPAGDGHGLRLPRECGGEPGVHGASGGQPLLRPHRPRRLSPPTPKAAVSGSMPHGCGSGGTKRCSPTTRGHRTGRTAAWWTRLTSPPCSPRSGVGRPCSTGKSSWTWASRLPAT